VKWSFQQDEVAQRSSVGLMAPARFSQTMRTFAEVSEVRNAECLWMI
jgi:hypothetical protein